jgi:tRNA (uracil-5-)-methyltransferase TRM9
MVTLREIYDKIAPAHYNLHHWTRFRPELEELASRWQKGRLLNLGCGHGADFLPFIDGFGLYGVDFSPVMLEFARKYAKKFGFTVNLFLADVCCLPFSDGAFDWAISVATYHHIKEKDEKQIALNELKRVLKPGGEAFITVWNRWQPWWGRGRGVDTLWFRAKEVDIPWQTKEGTLYRYYYFFSYPELEKLVRQAGFRVLKSFPENSYRFPIKFFSRNICLLVKKTLND